MKNLLVGVVIGVLLSWVFVVVNEPDDKLADSTAENSPVDSSEIHANSDLSAESAPASTECDRDALLNEEHTSAPVTAGDFRRKKKPLDLTPYYIHFPKYEKQCHGVMVVDPDGDGVYEEIDRCKNVLLNPMELSGKEYSNEFLKNLVASNAHNAAEAALILGMRTFHKDPIAGENYLVTAGVISGKPGPFDRLSKRMDRDTLEGRRRGYIYTQVASILGHPQFEKSYVDKWARSLRDDFGATDEDIHKLNEKVGSMLGVMNREHMELTGKPLPIFDKGG